MAMAGTLIWHHTPGFKRLGIKSTKIQILLMYIFSGLIKKKILVSRCENTRFRPAKKGAQLAGSFVGG